MAAEPPCKDDQGHDWREARQGLTALIDKAELCHRCAAIRFQVRTAHGGVTRYARTPRWGTPDDRHRGSELLPDLVTPAPVPETAAEAYERERKAWRERIRR